MRLQSRAVRVDIRVMRYWLKVTGTGDSPITDSDWFAVHRRWGQANGHFSGFSRRPNVAPGDRLVTYAAGSGQVFGAPRIYSVEQVTGRPEIGTHPRWTWAVTTEVVVAGPILTRAPTLRDIEVSTKSVRSHSHIRLSDGQLLHVQQLRE